MLIIQQYNNSGDTAAGIGGKTDFGREEKYEWVVCEEGARKFCAADYEEAWVRVSKTVYSGVFGWDNVLALPGWAVQFIGFRYQKALGDPA
jgi:hypothetical protein